MNKRLLNTIQAKTKEIPVLNSHHGMIYLENERIDDFIVANNIEGDNLRAMLDIFSTGFSKSNYVSVLSVNFVLADVIYGDEFINAYINYFNDAYNKVFSMVHKSNVDDLCLLLNRSDAEEFLPYKNVSVDFVIAENQIGKEKILSGFILSPLPALSNIQLKMPLNDVLKEAWLNTTGIFNIEKDYVIQKKTYFNIASGAGGGTKNNWLGYTTNFLRKSYRASYKQDAKDITLHLSKNKVLMSDIQCRPIAEKSTNVGAFCNIDNLECLEGWRAPKNLTHTSRAYQKTKTSKGIIQPGERFMTYSKKQTHQPVFPSDLTALRKNISNHVYSMLTEHLSTGILPFTCRLNKNTSKEELKATMKSFFRNINRGIKKNLRKSGKQEFNVKYVWKARMENCSGMLRIDLFITYPRSVYLTPHTKSSKHNNNNSLSDIVTLAWFKEHPNERITFVRNISEIYDTEKKIFPKSKDEVKVRAWYTSVFLDRPRNINNAVLYITNEFDNGFFNDPSSSYGLSRNK